jgi:hypothetical protein
MSGKMSLFVVPIYLGLLGWLATCSGRAQAQTEGNNAVYNSSMNVAASGAFVDASLFLPPHNNTQATDIFDAIYGIFTNAWLTWGKNGSYPANGTVIDARGVSGATNLKCTHGTPWTEGSTTVSVPSTILLPPTGGANPSPIAISATWYVPSNTKLIGEGENNSPSAGTTIQAASGFSGAMINLGPVNSVSRVDIGGNAG